MRWGCQRNNQRSPKILLFVISLLRLLPSGVPLCMGRSAGKRSVPFQSQIPCSPCPGLTALAGVSCGIGGQPVLEVGVVGADEDGGVFLVKIDFGGFFLLGQPSSHRLIFSAALSRNRGVFRRFSSAFDLGKMAIFKQERAGQCLPCPTRSHSIKCVFSGSTQESASFVPRDRFFSERMEESPQIITLNYSLIAADFPTYLASLNSKNAMFKYGLERYNALRIMENTLNLREIKLLDNGTEYNERDTLAALEKQRLINEEFKGGSGLMRTAVGWWKKPITTYLPAMKEALYPAEIRGTKIP